MNLYCLGINHRTAPIDIREKLWFSPAEIGPLLLAMREKQYREVVLVSTCNRTELYYVADAQQMNGEPLWRTLAKRRNIDGMVAENHFYALSGIDAVHHVFGVASGIDSMVLGDVQILNQMKEAFTLAQQNQTTGIILNRLFTAAFHVGKRARTETEIGEGAVSISYAAAELASKIFEDLSRRTALLIGAGETGKLTAKHLASRNLGKLLLANRTRKRAEDLIEHLGGEVVEYERIRQEIAGVDIVISSVDAPTHILTANDLKQAMKLRGNRPLFIIDIGVPRNIEPSANTIENIFLNDIDALNHIIDHNLTHRKAEVPKIETIICEEIAQFTHWHDSLEVTPTIQQLREEFERIRVAEVEKHLHHFTSDKHEEIEMLTRRIINKILHTPMVNLRTSSESNQPQEETRTKVFIIRHLFGLDKKAGT